MWGGATRIFRVDKMASYLLYSTIQCAVGIIKIILTVFALCIGNYQPVKKSLTIRLEISNTKCQHSQYVYIVQFIVQFPFNAKDTHETVYIIL